MIKVVRSYRSSRPVVNHFVLLGIGLFILTLFIFYAPRNGDKKIVSNKPLRSSRVNLNKDLENIQTGTDVNELKKQIQNLTSELIEERELVEELKETISELEQKNQNSGIVGAFSDLLHKNFGIGQNSEVENSNVCSAKKFYSSKSDIQMLKAYEQIPFDDLPGGVWKQGFNITYDAETIKKEEVLEVFVVPHSHNDPGWWYTFEGYFNVYTNSILTYANKYLHEFDDMRFIYAEMSFLELWWKQHSEDERQKMKEIIQKEHLEIVTGAWVMTDEANSHLYSIVTEMMEGHEFLKNVVGYKPTSHWSIDPFGLSPTISYILKQSNITNLVINRVHYSVKKFLAQTKDMEFHWRQLWAGDDSKTDVFTHMFPFNSYDVAKTCGPDPKVCCQFDFRKLGSTGCAEYGSTCEAITDNNIEQKATILADQYRKKAQLYKTNVLLVPVGDDFRYPLESEWKDVRNNFAKLFKYMNSKKDYNMKVRFGTLKDYFAASKLRQKDDIKVLSGDFFTYADRADHYWSGYYTSRPFYKHMDRTVQHYLRTADTLFTAWLWKHKTEGKTVDEFVGNALYDGLVEARRHHSVFQHHDGVTGTAKSNVVVDYAMKMLTAIINCQKVISAATMALNGLKADSKTEVDATFFKDILPTPTVFGGNFTGFTLFNPLPFKRTEIHCLVVENKNTWVLSDDEKDIQQEIHPIVNSDGEKLTLEKKKFKLCFETNIPAMGFRSFKLEVAKQVNFAEVYANFDMENDSGFVVNKLSQAIELTNEKITATLDDKTGLLKVLKMDGKETSMNLNFYQYGARSAVPGWNSKDANSVSGAYLFLPDGPAKPMPITTNQVIFIKGKLQHKVISKLSSKTRLVHTTTLNKDDSSLQIKNRVDIRSTHDFELSMRIQTDVVGDDFFSDLNGFQMIRRRRFMDKLPLQAHFFPMPSAAFIEDDKKRISLLGRQALGVASLEPGWMEVILDRRLSHDDDRGLQQSVEDNLQTESQFRILVEPITDGGKPKNDTTVGYHSLAAHHDLMKMHSGIVTVAHEELPCDINALSLRTITASSNYATKDQSNIPSLSAALVFQRFGTECGIESKLSTGTQCKSMTDSSLNLKDIFALEPKAFRNSSLTMLYIGDVVDNLPLDPMELKSVQVEF